MRIAIVNLTAGGMSGGYRKYLDTLIPLLRRDRRVDSLDVFVPNGSGLEYSDSVSLTEYPAKSGFDRHRELRKQIEVIDPDIAFIPTARWLDCGPIPVAVMIRNMEPLKLPLINGASIETGKNLLRYLAARNSCRRAARVLAVSKFVQEFLRNAWEIEASKIGTVYHGVESPSENFQIEMPRALAEGSCAEFIFTAGSVRPARGLEDVIRAHGLIQERCSPLNMVIAGASTPDSRDYEYQLQKLAAASGVDTRVIWVGQLKPSEMSWCYQRCRLFVMTSKVEACPNTALEAMSHGALCVSTDNPPMPEFFEGAAKYYSAGDAASLAQTLMQTLASSEDEKSSFRCRAIRRARQFSWEKTKDLTLSELQKCID